MVGDMEDGEGDVTGDGDGEEEEDACENKA